MAEFNNTESLPEIQIKALAVRRAVFKAVRKEWDSGSGDGNYWLIRKIRALLPLVAKHFGLKLHVYICGLDQIYFDNLSNDIVSCLINDLDIDDCALNCGACIQAIIAIGYEEGINAKYKSEGKVWDSYIDDYNELLEEVTPLLKRCIEDIEYELDSKC